MYLGAQLGHAGNWSGGWRGAARRGMAEMGWGAGQGKAGQGKRGHEDGEMGLVRGWIAERGERGGCTQALMRQGPVSRGSRPRHSSVWLVGTWKEEARPVQAALY